MKTRCSRTPVEKTSAFSLYSRPVTTCQGDTGLPSYNEFPESRRDFQPLKESKVIAYYSRTLLTETTVWGD